MSRDVCENLGENSPSRENSRHKSPVAGVSLTKKSRKVSVAEVEGGGVAGAGAGHAALPFVIHVCAQKQNRLLLIFLLTTPAPCPTSERKVGEGSLWQLPSPP